MAAHPRCRGTPARLGGAAVEEEVEDGAGDEDEAAGQHRGEVASVIPRRHAVGEACETQVFNWIFQKILFDLREVI